MFVFGKRSIIVICIMFIVMVVMGWAWRTRESLPFITRPFQLIATPIESVSSRMVAAISSVTHIVQISLKNRIEWEALESQNATLQKKSIHYDEVVAENKRLKELLDFRDSHPSYQLVAAAVISRDYGTWSNTMMINVGSRHGITKNMPVVTPKGIVGVVVDVYRDSSRVQLLTDPRTSIGAIVQRAESRVSSVVRGNGNIPTEPQFVNIAKDADILVGDTLVTSGFSSIYPKGIPIGTIVSIHQRDSDFVKYAVIRPAVDFSRLEEVFVIVQATMEMSAEVPQVEPKLVPQTQRDKVEGVKGAAAL